MLQKIARNPYSEGPRTNANGFSTLSKSDNVFAEPDNLSIWASAAWYLISLVTAEQVSAVEQTNKDFRASF